MPQVLLFNAIWFAVAIAAVVIFLLRRGLCSEGPGPRRQLARRHARVMIVLVFGLAGTYLATRGMTALIE